MQGQGWRLPADWGFRWDGWEGDANNPPAAPPAATPISKDEAAADQPLSGLGETTGSSWWMYAIGALLIIAGGWALLAIGATVGSIVVLGAGVVLTLGGSPAGQKAIEKFSDGIGLAIPLAVGIAAWFWFSGKRGKSR